MGLPIEQYPSGSPQHFTHSQRSRDIMLQLRTDRIFMERLDAGIHNPERGRRISQGLRANNADMARRKADVVRLQDEKPLPKMLREILALSLSGQNYLIAQAYLQLVSDPTRKELATFLNRGQNLEVFSPLMQGFLLMTHAYDQLQSPVSPQTSTMQKIRATIHESQTQQIIFLSLKKRKRLFHLVRELAYMRFPQPTINNSSIRRSHAAVSQREENRNYFLFGAALAYNLHLRMETMMYKKKGKQQ